MGHQSSVNDMPAGGGGRVRNIEAESNGNEKNYLLAVLGFSNDTRVIVDFLQITEMDKDVGKTGTIEQNTREIAHQLQGLRGSLRRRPVHVRGHKKQSDSHGDSNYL